MGGLHRQQTRGWGEEAHGAHTDKTGAMKWYAWGLVSRPYIQQRKVREEEKETKKDRVWCVYREKREQGTRKRKKKIITLHFSKGGQKAKRDAGAKREGKGALQLQLEGCCVRTKIHRHLKITAV